MPADFAQPVRRTIPESLRYVARELRNESRGDAVISEPPNARLLGLAVALDSIADEVGDLGERLVTGERYR